MVYIIRTVLLYMVQVVYFHGTTCGITVWSENFKQKLYSN